MQILKNPSLENFLYFIKKAKKYVYISSPFIKENIAKLIVKNLKKEIECKVLTKFTLQNLRNGSLDLSAIQILQNEKIKLKNISNLHSKIYIFDNISIIGSSNLTNGGLKNNLEYNIILKDNENIRYDFLEYFNDNKYKLISQKDIKKRLLLLKKLPKNINNNLISQEDIKVLKKNLSPANKYLFSHIDKIKSKKIKLEDIYKFKNEFLKIYKGKTPEATIRRNLQELRDLGLLEFEGKGKYTKLW